ncbi:glycoside hydrolase family 30 protein [Methylomicrobium sp. Wu6]|uniref:glycoside hydrolase family 30 protein n=1 Tax=Methylomicrobium sp. Wu6 TaxID=3107928 RepID=UPI002DD6ABFF|nr:glycoside hydrolase family 30 protein [Methylomicrobium sp. Wu6]MEC4748144.1 glycoside hydrolase family 30 protein [Methylomicrobium sp. Wu6]
MTAQRLVKQFCTARDTAYRLSELEPTEFVPASEPLGSAVSIDPAVKFQEFIGFGGAFTEAAAVTLGKMPWHLRQEILEAYFLSDRGNSYTLCRTPINSCDFSLGNYAYAEVKGDLELNYFNIDRDRQSLIPMILDAIKITKGKLKLFASPWSPPAWMKTNGQMNGGGKLRPEYRQAWANYYVRYIGEYGREGIPIWGLTVQNEPEASQIWDSCLYTGEEERDFVRDYLGPTLNDAGLGHVKLIIWDHNRDRMYERAKIVLDDPEAARYVWGVGFHWYCGDHFDNVQMTHDAYPDKHLIFTEGCQEGGPHLGSWDTGERYARSIINDLNRWTVAWVDWNLVLDERGGPNHVNNFCSAPIIADTRARKVLYQSSYYYIGHFSRFIRPGARRLACTKTLDALETTAFLNRDGIIVVVVLNRSEQLFEFFLNIRGFEAKTSIHAHAIKTYVFEEVS